MITFVCTVSGISALLQHRFSEGDEVQKATRKIHIRDDDPRVAAERCAYRTPEGALFLPGAAVARMLREAGGSHKQRGSRKSLKFVVPASVILEDDVVILRDEKGEPLTTFEVDSRPVVIPATKGRIMRHRPRLNSWSFTVNLLIDDDMIDQETVYQLFSEGGSKIGLGDYRPEKGGPFGRFQIVSWEKLADNLKKAA